MKNKKHIIFDLDGTIIDSAKGITESAKYGLQQMGIIENDMDALHAFIGPPLLDTFQTRYSMSLEDAHKAVSHYRTRFSTQGVHKNTLYPGIKELLISLHQKGKDLYIASTKPGVYIEEIIQSYSLENYFKSIIGSFIDGARTDKAELIKLVISENSLSLLKEIVMIGDHALDIKGANSANIDSIAVLYGFGDKTELLLENPTITAKSVDELKNLLV